MDCMSGDDPHWSATNNATYKEIWVEPVNRFMGALAVYLSEPEMVSGKLEKEETGVTISFENVNADSDEVICLVTAQKDLDLTFKFFNLDTTDTNNRLALNQGNSRTVELKLNVLDPDKPYIAVVTDVNKIENYWEAVGAGVGINF